MISSIYAPPISPPKSEDKEIDGLFASLDYSHYITQVIKELQGDPDFNKNALDITDAKDIANLLKYASGRVRSKLDELKRIEIARLNKLQAELKHRNVEENHPLEMPIPPRKPVDTSHLDDLAPESFNPEDLKRLIEKTSEIFNKIDAKDEEGYKYHEMEKKAEKRAEFEKIPDDTLRQEKEKKWTEEEMQKRSQHKVIHSPGSIEHLKNVWREDDHMDDESFNTKSFFLMHDMNSDGNWDIAELETLMQRELDKAYDPKNPDTDMIERDHEMTRMRNAFLANVDKDNNHLISHEEFNTWALSDEFKVDKQWKTQEEFVPNYSQEEFDQFYQEYLSRHPDLYQPTIQPTSTHPPL